MEITISNLQQFYGKKQVLKDINLTIPQGMYGLLGRNGAGKTTLMKTLTTLLPLTSGDVMMAGVDLRHQQDIRKIIGYLPQDFSLYGNMTAYEALDYLGVLSKIPRMERRTRIIRLLDQVNLASHKKTKMKAMSGGMRQRLGIAQALLNDPKILIVDEPTAGLDPEERLRFRNLLAEIAADKIVLLSTHIASDIEASADYLAIMNEGQIVFSGKLTTLLAHTAGKIFEVRIPQVEFVALKSQVDVIRFHASGTELVVRFIEKETAAIMRHPLTAAVAPTVEDAYLYCLRAGE